MNRKSPVRCEGVRRSVVGRGFTLIELLTVISIMGVLAAIGAGLVGVGLRKAREATVRSEHGKLVTAIEAYRGDFNQYPPDNAVNGVNVTPALNPLYYELVGTVSSNRGAMYHTSDRAEVIRTEGIQLAFNTGGFLNSAQLPARPKNYLPNLKEKQRAEVNLGGAATDIELLAVPIEWPTKYAAQAPLKPTKAGNNALHLRINPWQYVSTKPTNNAAGFDLWAEIIVGKQRKTISNWSP